MTLFTYKVQWIPLVHKEAPNLPMVTFEEVLLVFGQMGWELVSSHHKESTNSNLCVFKKAVQIV